MANFKHISIDDDTYDAIPSGSYVTGVKGSAETDYRTGNVNLSKTNVGLGNVPNVTTNNQTPTFAQASTRDNIASGEKLSVLFGKIMKFFADLKTVAFTGAYSDLTGQPTIPTVNNATLTIQKNGTDVQTFTANASSNKTANITVPTKTSELTNDSGYITDAGVTGVKGNSETNYRTGNVNITKANIGLGSVLNVSTNNQAPTFTQANTRTNIASGETLTVIMGKIMKFFADLKTVAFTGAYSDLSGKPTIPTVNNGRLTIQQNGNDAGYFTANQATDSTVNITVPTVNDGRLVIQKNGGDVGYFTANQSGKSTINLSIPLVDTSLSTSSTNAITNKAITTALNNTKNFNAIATNNSKVTLLKNGNGAYFVRCMDKAITITGTGLTTIDKISSSSNYPGVNLAFSGTISDGAGTKMYPCVLYIDTSGNIKIRQKNVTSDTLYLNVNGFYL